MGIPSYFSHVIRKYTKILRSSKYFVDNNKLFTHLYMDCNSIVYDSYHNISSTYDEKRKDEFEEQLIRDVAIRIEKYVSMINPTDVLYISFDGVAPLAKMEQQRTRRYKTHFSSNINYDNVEKKKSWNTSSITPGTIFMEKLSNYMYFYFNHKELQYNVKNIIVSCSDKPGEGEHKLYSHIRNSNMSGSNVSVYGLDADLIMLSIFHLKYCDNIYIFREAPEFLKNSIPVNIQNNSNEPYFLDIRHLSSSIVNEMGCQDNTVSRIDDYVFMCFLLGNDFLPHFPAMNIRTHGISVLLDVYKKHIGRFYNRSFISQTTGVIQWKYVNLFIQEIAKMEHELLKQEYFVRNKFDRRRYPETTSEEKQDVLLNCPIIYRQDEKYICPDEPQWEDRYYKNLFNNDCVNKAEISINYLQGIEWVYKYYTGDCPDWKWKYNYHYPPLFNDLCKYIPHFDTNFISINNNKPLFPYTQLAYVLPKSNLHLLPKKIQDFLIHNFSELYPELFNFKWAFCRYFWEAHPVLPEISNELLDTWNKQFILYKQQSNSAIL